MAISLSGAKGTFTNYVDMTRTRYTGDVNGILPYNSKVIPSQKVVKKAIILSTWLNDAP